LVVLLALHHLLSSYYKRFHPNVEERENLTMHEKWLSVFLAFKTNSPSFKLFSRKKEKTPRNLKPKVLGENIFISLRVTHGQWLSS